MTLAKAMQKEIEHVRKEAHVASMERVTQLTDENIALGKQVVQLRCDLSDHIKSASAEISRLEAELRVRDAAIRRMGRENFDLKKAQTESRMPMLMEEDMRRARSC